MILRPVHVLALVCLTLVGCQKMERLAVPDGVGPNVPCGTTTFAGFPVYAPIPQDNTHDNHRIDPTYFVCRPDEYALEFDPNIRVARWTVQVLDPAQWKGPAASRRNDVRPDPFLPSDVRSTPEHWKNVPYAPLQLIPASFVNNDEVRVGHTFYTSTFLAVDPLVFPASARLTDNIQRWAQERGRLVVISGPIFNAGVPSAWIGPTAKRDNPKDTPARRGKMAVPAFFYRVLLDPKTGSAVGFVLPNGPFNPADLGSRMFSVEQVEKWTGINFFPRLQPEQVTAVKSSFSARSWPIR
jgi:endonuclease G